MSVSTPFFDYAYAVKNQLLQTIESVDRKLTKLERKEARLERKIERNPTDRRLAKLEKVQSKIEKQEESRAGLTEALKEFSIELPSDSINGSVDTVTGNVTFTLIDSPYDATYNSEDKATVQLKNDLVTVSVVGITSPKFDETMSASFGMPSGFTTENAFIQLVDDNGNMLFSNEMTSVFG